MDTPHHNPTPEAERPAAVVEQVFSVQEALDARGFQAFYDKARPDGNVFDNPKDTEEVFKTFETSKSMARRFEIAMNAKLHEQNKGRLSASERQAYKTHVELLATTDPDKLREFEIDLNALETNPEEITAKEAEFTALREKHKPEKLNEAKVALEAKKEEIERANADRVGTDYGFLDRARFYLNRGKKAEDAEKQEKRDDDWEKLNAEVKALELQMVEAPQVIAKEQAALRKIKNKFESAREKIFVEHDVAKMVRERLLKDNLAELTDALSSTDLGKRQKAARKFKEEAALEEAGSGYLSGEIDGRKVSLDQNAYMKQMWEGGTTMDGKPIIGMKDLFEKGMREAIESLPLDAGQSRVLRAYTSFIRQAGAESGNIAFMDESESKDFIVQTLETAEEHAKKTASGTGRRIYYQSLIEHLKHPQPMTV